MTDARRRRLTWGLGGIAVLFAVAWLSVGWIVTGLANAAFSDRGFSCDSVSVTPSWDLRRVQVGPTRCRIAEGRVAAVRFVGGITAHLEDRRLRRIEAPAIEVELREDPPLEIQELLEGDEVPSAMRRAIDGVAELAARDDLPEVAVDRVVVRRRSRTVTLRDVRFVPGDTLGLTVASAAPPRMGVRRLSVEGGLVELSGQASRSSVSFTGHIDAEVRIGRFEATETMPFRLTGRALDTDEPVYALWVQPSPRLTQLRERLATLRARREERRQETERAPERLRELRDRLRDARERLETRTP